MGLSHIIEIKRVDEVITGCIYNIIIVLYSTDMGLSHIIEIKRVDEVITGCMYNIIIVLSSTDMRHI